MSTKTIRARDIGIPFNGIPGAFNSITDVPGVEVGHRTIIEDLKQSSEEQKCARTGVTVILPRGKDISGYLEEYRTFGAWYSLNGNGEMTGTTWLDESGFLGPIIAITNTYSVGTVRDGVIQWLVRQTADSGAYDDDYSPTLSLPVVAETWDGFLNDMNGFHVHHEHVFDAIEAASSGYTEEGNVGGGTGMVTHGFKGGIGTSSRKVGEYTVGVLVQSNYGQRRLLTIAGTPVGEEMSKELLPVYGKYTSKKDQNQGEGSIIVVVATDAPLLPHQLKRLARRVPMGIGLVGGRGETSSGDIFIAFSTANKEDMGEPKELMKLKMLPNEQMNPLFEAVVQATEEAILNAMIAAKTMEGNGRNKIYAISHDRIRQILKEYNKLQDN